MIMKPLDYGQAMTMHAVHVDFKFCAKFLL